MAREIDERKKRKALRKLRKAAQLAELGQGPPLSDWEKQFLEEVEARVETYGSAFADIEKGALDGPLSARQTMKLREIDKKARGKSRTGFARRGKPKRAANVRQINDDAEVAEPAPAPHKTPRLVSSPVKGDPGAPPARKTQQRSKPKLRVIRGGNKDD